MPYLSSQRGVMPSADLVRNPVWTEWQSYVSTIKSYLTDAESKFRIRDHNYEESFNLRHGLIPANVPPSHKDIVQEVTSKQANEILARLVAILSAKYPVWIYKPTGAGPEPGLQAARQGGFFRSFFLAAEERTGTPLVRVGFDQQLAYGGFIFQVLTRMDRWATMPEKFGSKADERRWKSQHPPFDVIPHEYNTVYYEKTVDGLTRIAISKMANVYDIAAQFNGTFNDKTKTLTIPVEIEASDDEGNFYTETYSLRIKTNAKEVDYTEFWAKGDKVCYGINGAVVRVDYLPPDRPLPFFLALGEVTSSPDPGRMGLPVLYNAFEDFKRLLNLRAMEDAFLYKHGFARVVRKRRKENMVGAQEPDLPDQEFEEETIGELIDLETGEEFGYATPANVSALFTDAKNDAKEGIQSTALADVLTGRLPPAGTTGYLMSQLASAATSKYIPILQQMATALAAASNYMLDVIDDEFKSEVAVPNKADNSIEGPFIVYRPGSSKGNRNLDIIIDAPLPSDQIAKTQWLTLGNRGGFVSRRRVQVEGYKVEQPELEDELLRLEEFESFYRPISMMKAVKRAGQMDAFLEAARLGVLPPALAKLVAVFARGPDGAEPRVTDNPNGVIQVVPGLGEPGVPTTEATANVRRGGAELGPAARPGGPRAPPEPERPLAPGGGGL